MSYVSGAPRDPTAVVGRRITAYVVDGLLTLVGFVVVLALVKHDTFHDAPADACSILRARQVDDSYTAMCLSVGSRAWLWQRGEFFTAVTAAAIVGILNLVVLQAVTGASLGKHALGLRVVDEQGHRAGLGRTIVRWLFLIVDGVIFLVGLIAVYSTRFHRRIGDLAAGTYVVGKASAGRPIGIASMPVPYGGPVFAAPAQGPIAGYGAPMPEPRAPMAPGWGAVAPPAPPAAPPASGSPWGSPPNPSIPGPQPAPPIAASAPAPVPPASSPPSVPAPPPPAPRPPPSPAPPPPSPGEWVPPAPTQPAPAPAPPRSTIPQPPPPERKLEPESWWDTAIPADPADGEEQS